MFNQGRLGGRYWFSGGTNWRGMAACWHLLAYRDWALGRLASARSAAERARTFAEQAGDEQWEARIIGLHGLILYWGPTPLNEVEKHSQDALSFARRSDMASSSP